MSAPLSTAEQDARAELERVVRIRVPTPMDIGRVYSDWLHSHWDTAKGRMPKTVYMTGQHRLIDELLRRTSNNVLIACTDESPTHILGWAAGEQLAGVAVFHFAYVRKEYRRLGIGRRLIEALAQGCRGRQHTHETKSAEAFIRAIGSTFNPYITGVAW